MKPLIESRPGLLRRLLGFVWHATDLLRRVVFNLLFACLVVLVLIALLSGDSAEVPDGVALVLAPRGAIVEQLSYEPPVLLLLREGVEEDQQDEVLLHDLTEAIDLAAEDARIQALVLKLERLDAAGLSKLRCVGRALDRFRLSGKPIIAAGDYYTQTQYHLAAHADEVYLEPMGGVMLQGFGVFRSYFRAALEKLKVEVHVFQVGTYKSALEPFLRDDMSPADREATLAWLEPLWQAYCGDISTHRDLPPDALQALIRDLPARVEQVEGDLAELALQENLVDAIKDRSQVRQRLIELVGAVDGDFRQIKADVYLRLARAEQAADAPTRPRIGLIVGRGAMVPGKQRSGRIGSESFSALLQKARRDPDIKAVVLRLDTGGGSAFAAEVIRREVLLTREAGKPVIASLSSVAASGGYWIASAADRIWAAPTTLTGSIGIFGAWPSLERSLSAVGIHTDGVGTTARAGAFDPRRPLGAGTARILQATVERGYARFLDVVATGRDKNPEEVDAIGQGRVWTGATARDLGLVDELGDLDGAIAAAADLAGLTEYEVTTIEAKPGARELVLRWLGGVGAGTVLPLDWRWLQLASVIRSELSLFTSISDPQGVYAWCLSCGTP